MTGEVVDFTTRNPHLQGAARCLACKHEWQAVAPVGATDLKCPSCACLRGVYIHPIVSEIEE